MTYKYTLEPYKGMISRYTCPECGKAKEFTRYIDIETGEHLADHVGKCSRENKCGYHYKPKQYFEANILSIDKPKPYFKRVQPLPIVKPVSFIPFNTFKNSLSGYEQNNFVNYLISLFGLEITNDLISKYYIGSSNHWQGANIFWQVDARGKIRTGKIMLYNPTTGKRVKEPYNHINWVHSANKQAEFNLQQCLFGEHLIVQDYSKTIAIVESEKTAIIASVYLPQFTWLAVGSLTNLTFEKCKVLKGFKVVLFPDLKGFEKWNTKAKELSTLACFTVSDLLERKATETEKQQGFDLADYLIKFDYKAFALPEPEATEPPPAVQPLVEVKPFEQPKRVYYFGKPEQPKPESWEQDITELENYFTGIVLPTQPIKLNRCSTITNCSLFIESQFATVKANNGKRTFLSFLNRLQELKEVLTTNLN